MFELSQHLVAVTAQLRQPHIFANIPIRFWKILRPPALALFEHSNRIAFFRETQSGDAATKPRTYDNEIIIETIWFFQCKPPWINQAGFLLR